MKRCFLVALTLLTLIACQRSEDWPFDSARTDNVNIFSKEPVIIISKEEALKRVEPLASRYPDRWIDISDGIIPAGTTIAYNAGGEYDYQWYSTNPAWMITGYIASTASVLEGLTDNPVSLVVSFYDPLGEQITVSDQVYPVS